MVVAARRRRCIDRHAIAAIAAVVSALITALGTLGGAYFGYIKPSDKQLIDSDRSGMLAKKEARIDELEQRIKKSESVKLREVFVGGYQLGQSQMYFVKDQYKEGRENYDGARNLMKESRLGVNLGLMDAIAGKIHLQSDTKAVSALSVDVTNVFNELDGQLKNIDRD